MYQEGSLAGYLWQGFDDAVNFEILGYEAEYTSVESSRHYMPADSLQNEGLDVA
jgi:hypothetical protein